MPGGHLPSRAASGLPTKPADLEERRCLRVLDHRPHGPYVRDHDDQDERDYWCPGGPPTPLIELEAADRHLTAARDGLDEAVRRARAAGHSYADVGAVLGVSRQAAWERFGRAGKAAS